MILKKIFMNRRLEYIYKTKQEVVFDLDNESSLIH